MQRKQARIHKRDSRWVATYFVTQYVPYRTIHDVHVWLCEADQDVAHVYNDGNMHTIELIECVPCDRAPSGWDCLAKIVKKDEDIEDSRLNANINSI
jgi:hypothetical protein